MRSGVEESAFYNLRKGTWETKIPKSATRIFTRPTHASGASSAGASNTKSAAARSVTGVNLPRNPSSSASNRALAAPAAINAAARGSHANKIPASTSPITPATPAVAAIEVGSRGAPALSHSSIARQLSHASTANNPTGTISGQNGARASAMQGAPAGEQQAHQQLL